MKPKSWLVVGAMGLGIVILAQGASVAAERQPRVGQNIGNVSFAAPVSEADAAYLGLAGQRPFTLSDIKAPYVIVESMHTT